MVHTCVSNTGRWRQEDHEFKVALHISFSKRRGRVKKDRKPCRVNLALSGNLCVNRQVHSLGLRGVPWPAMPGGGSRKEAGARLCQGTAWHSAQTIKQGRKDPSFHKLFSFNFITNIDVHI